MFAKSFRLCLLITKRGTLELLVQTQFIILQHLRSMDYTQQHLKIQLILKRKHNAPPLRPPIDTAFSMQMVVEDCFLLERGAMFLNRYLATFGSYVLRVSW